MVTIYMKKLKKIFEMYGTLVNDGIIAFHDIVTGPEESVGEVPEFWEKIKRGYSSKEIVKDKSQGESGIGILIVGK